MKQLIIVNRKTNAKAFATALPDRYGLHAGGSFWEGEGNIIIWTGGRISTLALPEAYNARLKSWRAELLPIIPTEFKMDPKGESKRQFQIIRQLVRRKDIGRIIVATEPDAEGDLEAAAALGPILERKEVRRFRQSLPPTPENIVKSMGQLIPFETCLNLARASEQKKKIAWLFSINASRALTRKHGSGQKSFSAGYVISPILARVARREMEMQKGTRDEWKIYADIHLGGPLRTWKSSREGRVWVGKSSETKFGAAKKAKLLSCTEAEKEAPCPPLFSLPLLQQEAEKKLGYSAAKTALACLTLYRKHKAITYPLTDSTGLPAEMIPEAELILNSIIDKGLVGIISKRVPYSGLVCDRDLYGHHAIIPSGQMEGRPRRADLLLFNLIAHRFTEAFRPRADVRHMRFFFEIDNHFFVAERPAESGANFGLESGNLKGFKVLEIGTAPAGCCTRYTDSDIVLWLQENGIGPPISRALAIEWLISSRSIYRSGTDLVPTEDGMELYRAIENELIGNIDLVRDYEHTLELVARGDLRQYFSVLLDAQLAVQKLVASILSSPSIGSAAVRCPRCDRKVIFSSRSTFCSGKCGFRFSRKYGQKIFTTNECRKLMAGETIVCSNFHYGKRIIAAVAFSLVPGADPGCSWAIRVKKPEMGAFP